MSGSKQKRQIRKLVQLLIKRYNVTSIYTEDIADCLECSPDVVEDELGLLYEEWVLKPVFETRCGMCGNIISTYGSPCGVTVGLGIAECLWCMNQQKVFESDLARAWAACEEE